MQLPYEVYIGLRYLRAKRRQRTISLNTFVSVTGITLGVAALIGEVALFRGFRRRAEIIRIVRDYDSFTPDNDPIGEHDFGRFEFEDAILYWKIDYYDLDLSFGSPDPTSPDVTTRVLTILRADEY